MGRDHVLAGQQDSPDHNDPETNSQVADLLAALRILRGDLVREMAALYRAAGYVDHGRANRLAIIHTATMAVEAEGGGDG